MASTVNEADQLLSPTDPRLIEVSGVLVVGGEIEADVPDHRDVRSERLEHLLTMPPTKI